MLRYQLIARVEEHMIRAIKETKLDFRRLPPGHPHQAVEGLKKRWSRFELTQQGDVEPQISDICANQPPKRRVLVPGRRIEHCPRSIQRDEGIWTLTQNR